VHALEARHFALWGSAPPAERLALAREMVRLAEEMNAPGLLLRGHVLRLADLLELGRIREVDAAIAAYARLAEELRQPRYHWGLNMFRAARALMQGRFAEAERLAAEALAQGQRVQEQTAMNFYAVQMFFLRREQGRLGELEASLESMAAQYPAVPGWHCALASLYAEIDRESAARAQLDILAGSDFRILPRDGSWRAAIGLAADACVYLRDRSRAAVLYDLLLPHDGLTVVAPIACVCSDAVARHLGALATVLERWSDAERHFEQALELNRALGAPPLVARTELDYGAGLLARGRPLDRTRARSLLRSSAASAEELGMKRLSERAAALLGIAVGQLPVASPIAEGAESESPMIRGGATAEAPPRDGVVRCDGDYWTIGFRGRDCRIRDTKGMRYIARLLRDAGRELHALDLARAAARTDTAASGTPQETPRLGAISDLGGILDEAAKRSYGRRLEELRDDLDEAQRFNDLGRAASAEREIDFIRRELAGAVGLHGRDRAPGSAVERARLSVTKAVKATLKKIERTHPGLAHHLRTCIKTGTYCSYQPDPTQPFTWTL
jgi:tetratricopeptide (TPR) repeat protein